MKRTTFVVRFLSENQLRNSFVCTAPDTFNLRLEAVSEFPANHVFDPGASVKTVNAADQVNSASGVFDGFFNSVLCFFAAQSVKIKLNNCVKIHEILLCQNRCKYILSKNRDG